MCFYDQFKYDVCGDYKWGHFRQHCAKEYRTGETCGMKLVMATYSQAGKCKICTKIETKLGRIKKEEERIRRWRREHGRRASIEASEEIIAGLQQEVNELWYERSERTNCL
jgi:hypothetical protein